MRCRCCNNVLTNSDKPAWNKLAKAEDDLCVTCRHLVYNSYVDHEYVGGKYPVNGTSTPARLKDN